MTTNPVTGEECACYGCTNDAINEPDEPSWCPCGWCDGTGTSGTIPCPYCHGNGGTHV